VSSAEPRTVPLTVAQVYRSGILSREIPDDLHSPDEPRTLTIGLSNRNRCLVVVTSYRNVQLPRIISAWRATKRERNEYERRRR
jgi:uncharacterized DUF497 family protein